MWCVQGWGGAGRRCISALAEERDRAAERDLWGGMWMSPVSA